jgi:type II secretion system protein G
MSSYLKRKEAEVMKRREAFTLIELLIVVAIIAILAAIAVPNFLEAQVRSKISRTKSDLRSLATAWEAYRLDNNMYPPDYDSGAFGVSPDSEYLTYAAVTTPVAYMTSVPLDIFIDRKSKEILHKPVNYYQYYAPDGKVIVDAEYARAGLLWIMTTMGPDFADQELWAYVAGTPDIVANLTYDASNGTKSLGDLGRSNKQFYPAQ